MGLVFGALVEVFMIKVWIGKTNFYEVVKRKEAEKRAEAKISAAEAAKSGEKSFGEILKLQWEEKKKEMAQREAAGS